MKSLVLSFIALVSMLVSSQALDISISHRSAEDYLFDSEEWPTLGRFSIEFKVTTFDEDIFIELQSSRGTSSNLQVGASFIMENIIDEEVLSGTTTSFLEIIANGINRGNFIEVEEGHTATLRLITYFQPQSLLPASYRMQLHSITTNTVMAEGGSPYFIDEDGQTPALQLRGQPVPEPGVIGLFMIGALMISKRKKP